LRQTLENLGVKAQVLSAIGSIGVVEVYSWEKALKYLKKERVVIFAGGTGNPYFTTDTAAAMRACETDCEILIKGRILIT